MRAKSNYLTVAIPAVLWALATTPDALAQGNAAAPAVAQGADSNPWASFGFGLGLSYTIDTGKSDRVRSAQIIDGLVRVTDEQNGVPRLVLEGHYFFRKPGRYWGHGPFVAVQPGDDDIINAVAMGYMVGFRYSENSSNSWNLGVGVAADPREQVLGTGFKENEAPPGTEAEIRYATRTQYGLMILFSASWGG